ncbi:MAG TPA: hypothetical protein PKM73_10450 [Verrucomicrobiota bacterium]|nr:hypothetical protein [Verrucomicrobiota bacterium]HNU51090.1 hypothetical protein [Verrucomicrobiota bacterium]
MPDKINIPDQEDILAINERLTADNQRLTAELTAATDLLETAQQQTAAASQRADQLAGRIGPLETAAKVAGEELTRLKAENAQLTAKMADFNTAVAAEVQKLGLRPKAADHKEAPAQTDLTPTQRVLAVKGVGSLAELRPQS